MGKRLKTEDKIFIFDNPKENGLRSRIKSVLYPFVAWQKKLLMTRLGPKQTDKKYNVSVCAIFRNEAKYLREWIEFHRIVGIDHFYLYDNFSADSPNLVLTKYIKSGIVTLIEWPKPQGQMSAYADCAERFSNETKWIGFLDLDELFVPNSFDNVYDFLKPFEEKRRQSVVVYWKMFGTSGKISRDITKPMSEDLTVAWPKYSDIGKFFFNTAYPFYPNDPKNNAMHEHWSYIGKRLVPPVNIFDKPLLFDKSYAKPNFPVQINHYFTKSYDEYLQKCSRGDAFFENNPRDFEYFLFHEKKCCATDYHAYRFLIELKLALQKNEDD